MTGQQPPFGNQPPQPQGYLPQGAASWNYDAPGAPQPPTGWRPAPRPGLFPLRPLTFGELFSATFRMLRMNVAASFGGVFLVQTISNVLAVVLPTVVLIVGAHRLSMTTNPADNQVIASAMLMGVLLSLIPAGLMILFGSGLSQIIVAQVVADGALSRRATLGQAFRAARKRFWALLGYLVLMGVGSLLLAAAAISPFFIFAYLLRIEATGALAFLILGILTVLASITAGVWIYTKLLLAPAAIVLEHLGPIAAIRRSWQLTDGYFWRTFGISILVNLIVNVASQIVSTIFSFIGSFFPTLISPDGGITTEGSAIGFSIAVAVITVLLATIVSAISTVIMSSSSAIMYADLRMRKEGLNIQLQQAAEDYAAGREPAQSPWRSPFTPHQV